LSAGFGLSTLGLGSRRKILIAPPGTLAEHQRMAIHAFFVALFAAAALALPGVVGQQAASTPPPELQQAGQLLAQQDAAGAIRILEPFTRKNPDHAGAWRLLGTALQRDGRIDRAIKAYEKALAIGPDAAAMYAMGTAYAQKKDVDRAFEWLGKARATGSVDMTAIQVDANLEGLEDDPRFAALLPPKSHFAKPFVENTDILREWAGDAINGQFGWIARGIGDVDGDKVADVVTSAPFRGTSASPAGRIYVYSSRTGVLLWKADGAEGERLGIGLETAGDVNNDSVEDVVASAIGSGKAYVYSGKDGGVLLTLRVPDSAAPLSAVASAGDVNRDGRADIIAGAVPRQNAPNAPRSPTGRGKVYVFSGADGKVLLTLTGEADGDGFGSAVAGDADRGQPLLVVGAPGAGPRTTGRAYVYKSLSTTPAFTIDSDETGAALGAMFVAIAGDTDGDEVPDVYASDFPNRAKGPSTGRVYVHSGKTGARLLTLTGETAGEGFGTSASHAGDVDGDGHADLAVGAWQYAATATSGGRIYIHSGQDGRLLRTITCRVPGDTLGFDSVGIGDTNGDGIVDLLVTSAYSGINGHRSGRVFIVSSGIHRK
jgi:hypothetical protein